jgi:hypothetical protein
MLLVVDKLQYEIMSGDTGDIWTLGKLWNCSKESLIQRPKINKQESLLRSHQTTKRVSMYINAKCKEYTIDWELQWYGIYSVYQWNWYNIMVKSTKTSQIFKSSVLTTRILTWRILTSVQNYHNITNKHWSMRCSSYRSFGISKINKVEGFYSLRVQVL